jgi:microsomal dipeptidase-like Zn-dependent dipeptidase
MVDNSHPSKESNMQAMLLSRAPVIASHSAARAMSDHSRNLDDEQLLALKENGGVVQTVAFRSYLNGPKHTAWQEARQALITQIAAERSFQVLGGRGGGGGRGALQALSETERERYLSGLASIEEAADARLAELGTTPPVDVTDLVDHID